METTVKDATEKDMLATNIEQQLVAYNVTDAVLSSLKEKYSGLKLRSLDDKEGYLEIKEAAKDCSKVRNLIVKCCKAGREDAVKIQKLWVAKEKEVVAKVTEVEAPLDAEIKTYNDELDRKANEEKRRQEEAYMQRTQILTKMSALYSDGCFVLGDFSIEGNLVKESSDQVWNEEILPQFNIEYQKSEAERIEIERKKAEHEAEIKNQQEELAQKQREFEAQQVEFKKQQDESIRVEREKLQEENRKKEEAGNIKLKDRLSLLAGWGYNGFTVSKHGEIFGSKEDMISLSDDEYKILVRQNEQFIIEEINRQEEKKQTEIATAKQEAIKKEQERQAEENRQSEIKRQQEDQRKAEELAKAGDKAQWDNFIEGLSKLIVPTARSGQYRSKTAIAREKISEIIALK